jgi:hypothetical protein
VKRIILVYGTLAGAVVIGSAILSLNLADEGSLPPEWLGYLVMIVAFSLIFVGIKRYRDIALGGVIRFGTALGLGLGITVVASAIYVVAWEINLALTDHAFVEEYTQSLLDRGREAGKSPAELDAMAEEMETMKRMYANPAFRVPITFLEIFPVGLLISLVSAAILRNSRVLPAVA